MLLRPVGMSPPATKPKRVFIMATELKFKGENGIIGTSYNDDGSFTIGVKGHAPMTIRAEDLTPEVRAIAIMKGMGARLIDAGAIARNTTTGLSATPAEKDAAIRALFLHYTGGATEWNIARAAGPRGTSLDSLALQAVGEAYGKDVDVVRAMVKTKAEEYAIPQAQYLAKLTTGALVAPIYKRLTEEALAKVTVDVDANPFA